MFEDSPHALWSSLNPTERSRFLKTIEDPTSSLALMHQAIEDTVEPWWTVEIDPDPGGTIIGPSRTRHIGPKPKMMTVPPSLIPRSSSSKVLLIYNIVAIMFISFL